MKISISSKISPLHLAFILLFVSFTIASAQEREYIFLKTYFFSGEEQIKRTEDHLEKAFLPSVKSYGFDRVGIFKNRITEKDSVHKIFVLIPHSTLEDLADLEVKLMSDANYQEVGSDYILSKHDDPPFDRTEITLMKAFEDMPALLPSKIAGERSERVYELRSYEAATEKLYRSKVDMFNAGGEINLFEELGFNAVFYAEVLAGSAMPNLVYMTTHENMEVRDQNWKKFVDAPAWKEMSSLEKYQNTVSRADIYLLYPTSYSDY